jgi:N-methylhydantoinase A/oxoprolinase/acetone carboxylase beta subunit
LKAHIDIDTGGTFTDAFIVLNGRSVYGKAPTTPHRLSEGCIEAVRIAAEELGLSLDQLLKNTDTFRFSTTYATNALIQKIGPKLGLITTEGFEDLVIIGKGSSWADKMTVREMRNPATVEKPKPLIPRDLTVGVKERVDYKGRVIRPLDEDDLADKIRYLVDKGVQGLVVSLMFSYLNPVHEKRIQELVRRKFSRSSLGSILPVILSSEVCPKCGEYTRSTTTILNAYLHKPIQAGMMDLAGEMRKSGYSNTLFAIHCTGGMAPVYRTTPLQTYGAGPIAGLMAGAYLGQELGHNNVVVSDMGGTSFDLSLVVQGNPRFYEIKPVVEDWWVDMTMLWVRSIGAGGGSIAWLNPLLNDRLEVGPRSAGSVPGPAAYGKGIEPTVTDADIMLGYIDPNYFYGGRIRLNKELSNSSIKSRIADPMGADVVEAARLIKKVVDYNMASIIVKETSLRGHDPRDFVLFAAGGAGPTHCCGYGFNSGLEKIMVFPFSAAFCALGSAGMDITHIYGQSKKIVMLRPEGGGLLEDYSDFNQIVEGLRQRAILDANTEGFSADELTFRLELEMKFGGQVNAIKINSPSLFLENEGDTKAVCDTFLKEFAELYTSLAMYPEGGIELHTFNLHSILRRPKIKLPTYPLSGESVSRTARKGERMVYWEEYRGFRKTRVIDQAQLKAGNIIEGPAIIEMKSTSLVLDPGAKLTVDKFLCLQIEKMV